MIKANKLILLANSISTLSLILTMSACTANIGTGGNPSPNPAPSPSTVQFSFGAKDGSYIPHDKQTVWYALWTADKQVKLGSGSAVVANGNWWTQTFKLNNNADLLVIYAVDADGNGVLDAPIDGVFTDHMWAETATKAQVAAGSFDVRAHNTNFTDVTEFLLLP